MLDWIGLVLDRFLSSVFLKCRKSEAVVVLHTTLVVTCAFAIFLLVRPVYIGNKNTFCFVINLSLVSYKRCYHCPHIVHV